MLSHGFVSGAMFMCIGVLYDRLHTRQIADYGGVVNVMPKFAALFLLFSMANAGLPGTSAFVGEFSSSCRRWREPVDRRGGGNGADHRRLVLAVDVQARVFGAVGNERVAQMKDVGLREFWMLFAMALLVLGLGVYPKPVTDMMDVSVQALLQHVSQSKLQ